MPTSRKRESKGKHIVARSITLKDAKGNSRIYMNAGDGNGFVVICLFGNSGRSIQISTSPDGAMKISLLGKRCTVSATLGMTPDEDAGLSICNRQGLPGTMLGSVVESGTHRLTVFRDGQPYWTTPDLSGGRKSGRLIRKRSK